jgi:hypothetical protein
MLVLVCLDQRARRQKNKDYVIQSPGELARIADIGLYPPRLFYRQSDRLMADVPYRHLGLLKKDRCLLVYLWI